MTEIGDLTIVSKYLGTSGLTEHDDIYRLISCVDYTTVEVVSVSGGVTTVVDNEKFAEITGWLATKGVVDQASTVSTLLALADDGKTHHLRGGELLKTVLYAQLIGYSHYSASGYLPSNPMLIAQFAPAIVSPGYVTDGKLLKPEGYLPFQTQQGQILRPDGTWIAGGVGNIDGGFGYGVYSITPQDTGWMHLHVDNPRALGDSGFVGEIAWKAYDQSGSLTRFWLGNDSIVNPMFERTYRAALSGHELDLMSGRAGLRVFFRLTFTPTGMVFRLGCALWNKDEQAAPASPAATESVSYDMRPTSDPKIWSTFSIRLVLDGLSQQISFTMAPEISYVPNTTYNGQEYVGTNHTYQLNGLEVTVEGSGDPRNADVTVDGAITTEPRPNALPYRGVGDTITAAVCSSGRGRVTVPTKVSSASPVPVRAQFGPDGKIMLGYDNPVAGYTVLTTEDLDRDLASVVNTALATYDAASIYEGYDEATVASVQSALGRTIINDAYLAAMADYTKHVMCSAQVSAIRQYMISEQGDVDKQGWDVNYFADADLSGGVTVPAYPWSRVRLADETTYYPVTEASGIGVYYRNGMVFGSGKVHIENFVFHGISLDEWWAQRDDASDLYAALEETNEELDTQMLLYQTVNGVINATDWLSDVGGILSEAVSAARDATMAVLSMVGPYKAIGVEQRAALLGAEAAVAVPATRVAEMLEAASALGATSAQQAMQLLSALPSKQIQQGVTEAYTMTQVQNADARAIMDMLVALTNMGQLNSTQMRKPVTIDTPYMESYVGRLGSSILSAGGVESEFADMGTGALAIYPALVHGTVYLHDVDLPHEAVVLPLQSSIVVLYPGIDDSQRVVSWYSKFYGGSDDDAVQCMQDSLKEMQRLINAVGEQFDVSYQIPNLINLAESDADYVNMVGRAAIVATGALSGAGIGSMLGPAGTAVGTLVGTCLSVAGVAMTANYDAYQDNLDYRVQRIIGECGTVTIAGSSTADPDVIGAIMASTVAACVAKGGFIPYGNRSGQLVNPYRFALTCGGNPYFRYVYVGEHEDYTPMIISVATIATMMSLRTMLKAWRNPARIPSFLPVVLGGAVLSASAQAMSSVSSAVSTSKDATLKMQKDILSAVDSLAVSGETGTFTDEYGTVTLRDIMTDTLAMKQMINSLELSVEANQPTSLTY